MPMLTVWALRLALAHFVVGWTIGASILLHKGGLKPPQVWSLLDLHLHALLFGWTVQGIIGVGYWILPKFVGGDAFRGNTGLAVAAVVLVNAGVVAAALPFLPRVVPFIGHGLAAVAFGAHLWPRVKAFGASRG